MAQLATIALLRLSLSRPAAGSRTAALAPDAPAAGAAWHVVEGYNAVMGETCSSDPACRAVRAAGRAATAMQCQAMCTALGASNASEPCTVFAWSGSTHSCWLRSDGLWGAPGTLVPEAKRVSGCLRSTAVATDIAAVPGCGTDPLARRPKLGTIVAAPSATAIELDAAAQLSFYLGNLGGWLPKPNATRPVVAVGYAASIATGLVGPADLAGLGDDGFVIVSNGSAGALVVTGGRRSARGCLFGVLTPQSLPLPDRPPPPPSLIWAAN
eukprot:SAG22_NODE_100_length_20558_cov_10.189305_16_plen_269_part_00